MVVYDIFSGKWLMKNRNTEKLIYSNYWAHGNAPLISYGGLKQVWKVKTLGEQKSGSGYIYYENVKHV